MKDIKKSELWDLDQTIVNFIQPRLKAFRKCNYSYPNHITFPEWQGILKKMDRAFTLLKKKGCCYHGFTEDEIKEIEVGRQLFHDYFFHLWI